MPHRDGHNVDDQANTIASGGDRLGRDVFAAAVRMTRMAMVLSDPNLPDCPIVWVNEAFVQMSGYPEGDVLGHNCRFLQGDKTDRATVERIAQRLAERQEVSEEILNYRRDGTEFWCGLFISPVYDDDGRLIYFFGSQLDVTAKRHAQLVAAQNERLDALGFIASSVAHEFNNLMQVVAGNLSGLREQIEEAGAPTTEAMLRKVDRSVWATEYAAKLTRQMLNFSRQDRLEATACNLADLVRDMDALLKPAVGSRIALEIEVAADPLPVILDHGRFELAIMNLARNAADAMGKGGRLRIRTERRGDNVACVVVADNGDGMSAATIRSATQPFFTTKPAGKGTGLGLAMVHDFMQQSEGIMHIDSTPGRGTEVRLCFPLNEGDKPTHTAPHERSAAA